MYKPQLKNPADIEQIVRLALQIQNSGIGTSFVDLHLHVGIVGVRVYIPSWHEDVNPAYTADVYFGEMYSEAKVKSIINDLQTILKEN